MRTWNLVWSAALIGILLNGYALASNVKKEARALGVFVDASGFVTHEELVVGHKFWRKADRYVLVLSIDELRPDGSVFPLGEQEIALIDTTFLFDDSVNKQVVVEVPWSTTDFVAAGNTVLACTYVIEIDKKGGETVASDEQCASLVPTLAP